MADLTDIVNVDCGTVLNASDGHDRLSSVFDRSNGTYLESDADEQLLLYLPLKKLAKLRAIRIQSDPEDKEKIPRTIKLFINKPSMDFSDCETEEPIQTIELSEDEALNGETIKLKYVKFQNVSSVTIFIEDSQGAETSVVNQIALIGTEIGEQFGKLEKVG